MFNKSISLTNKLMILDSLSLTVQPVPGPCSTKALANNKINDGGNSQKLILFNLGNLLSQYFHTGHGLCLHQEIY